MAIKFTEWQIGQLQKLADAWRYSNIDYCENCLVGLYDKAESFFVDSKYDSDYTCRKIKEGRFGFPMQFHWVASNESKTEYSVTINDTVYEVEFIGTDDEREVTAPIGDGGKYEDQQYETLGIANGQKYSVGEFMVFENGKEIDAFEFMETDQYTELCQVVAKIWGGDELFIED